MIYDTNLEEEKKRYVLLFVAKVLKDLPEKYHEQIIQEAEKYVFLKRK